MGDEETTCWICGAVATTREHKIKRSDIVATFGSPTQASPVRLHTTMRRNIKVQSSNSDYLKSSAMLCEYCNSARTQPYDLAWQKLADHLRSIDARHGPRETFLRANKVFPYNTRLQVADVQLYFVKLFGCHVLEMDVAIDVRSFAKALMSRTPHPNIYIELISVHIGTPLAHTSDMHCVNDPATGRCVGAVWVYHAGRVAVRVQYAEEGQTFDGMRRSWHPRLSTTKLPLLKDIVDLEELSRELAQPADQSAQ